MRPAATFSRVRRQWKRQCTLAVTAGFLTALLIVRSLPPAPAFSTELGRATYLQSYETAYFASVRAYEDRLEELLRAGYTPVVVFGDSSIRGSGAVGEEVWTRLLEQRLRVLNPRVRVLNYAQNAGDLMGPFLYHHLQARFPQAYYIVQWHFGSEVGVRHQFHYWLTSEIALRDGQRNPAIRHSFHIVPLRSTEEGLTFALAAFDIATHYLDAGNWVRYRWLGRMWFDAKRQVAIEALSRAKESDVRVDKFVAPTTPGTIQQMSGYFAAHLKYRSDYVQRPFADRAAYLADMYPPAERSHLLLLTIDFNPFYAPQADAASMETWRSMWRSLRRDMARLPDLRWVGLTAADGVMQADDYMDLGHFTPAGQRRIAETVADMLLMPGGWFNPAAPGTVAQPVAMTGRWCNISELLPYQREVFREMSPVPARFFATYQPALYGQSCFAHPEMRLCFRVPAGRREVRTTLTFISGAYENVAPGDATDGVQFEVALLTADGRRTVVMERDVDPVHRTGDREIVPLAATVDVPAGAEIELHVGPGAAGRNNRDWVLLGPITIR